MLQVPLFFKPRKSHLVLHTDSCAILIHERKQLRGQRLREMCLQAIQ